MTKLEPELFTRISYRGEQRKHYQTQTNDCANSDLHKDKLLISQEKQALQPAPTEGVGTKTFRVHAPASQVLLAKSLGPSALGVHTPSVKCICAQAFAEQRAAQPTAPYSYYSKTFTLDKGWLGTMVNSDS